MHIFSGALGGFAHRIGYCICFTNANTDATAAITDHNGHSEGEPPAAFDHFSHTGDIHHAFLELRALHFRKFVF